MPLRRWLFAGLLVCLVAVGIVAAVGYSPSRGEYWCVGGG